MTGTFLDTIIGKTRSRLDAEGPLTDTAALEARAFGLRSAREPHLFRKAVSNPGRINIIAEIKRSSPSKGEINSSIDVVEMARSYIAGGAAAISVLTESEYFGGSMADLAEVCSISHIPVIRKDFIVDRHQIFEAAAARADAVLLIVAALSEVELAELYGLTHDDLGLDAIVEVHDLDELAIAEGIGASIIGVNNRDLHSLEVSLDVSRSLIRQRTHDCVMVSESGLSTRDEIEELRGLGFDAFLIGETLMRADNIAATLLDLTELRVDSI